MRFEYLHWQSDIEQRDYFCNGSILVNESRTDGIFEKLDLFQLSSQISVVTTSSIPSCNNGLCVFLEYVSPYATCKNFQIVVISLNINSGSFDDYFW